MNYQQLNEILDIFKDIPDAGRRDKAVQLMLQTASDSITLERLQSITSFDGKEQDNEEVFWKFSAKESNS